MSTLPPPVDHHKLEGCLDRFGHQLERTKRYLDLVLPVLPQDEDDESVQFLLQSLILMLHTFMEEFFRCIVSLGTLYSAPEVRSYLAGQYPKEAEAIEVTQLGPLIRRAQKEVSYKDGAAKLKGILALLTTAGPYADEKAALLCSDLVAVRNIITHQGGWPTESDVPTVKSPHVSVTATASSTGPVPFYRLRIGRQFMVDVRDALVASLLSVEAAVRNDPRYI